MTHLPPELDGLALTIGSNWFFDKFTCIHGFATVSKNYGIYLSSLDPKEAVLHVDYPEHAPSLAYVYSIANWKDSLRRMTIQKQESEARRREIFAREEAAMALAAKYKEREDEVQRILNLIRAKHFTFYTQTNKKILRDLVIRCLTGVENNGVKEKLGIHEDDIAHFNTLPQPTVSEEETLLGLMT